MLRIPVKGLLLVGAVFAACASYGLWAESQHHKDYLSERTKLIPKLSYLLNRGYTIPAEGILDKYPKEKELDNFREVLSQIKIQQSAQASEQFQLELQRQLYQESGDFLVTMAMEQLSQGDYDSARQTISLFDKIPELDPVRRKIDLVEAELGTLDTMPGDGKTENTPAKEIK